MKFRIISIFVLLGSASASAFSQTPKVVLGAISEESMMHGQAMQYCANQGGRLPSDRDYANWAAENGAKIRETRFANLKIYQQSSTFAPGQVLALGAVFPNQQFADEFKKSLADGYRPIIAGDQSAGVNTVSFYINSVGYKSPDLSFDDLTRSGFPGGDLWTSDCDGMNCHTFVGKYGDIVWDLGGVMHPVRCVK